MAKGTLNQIVIVGVYFFWALFCWEPAHSKAIPVNLKNSDEVMEAELPIVPLIWQMEDAGAKGTVFRTDLARFKGSRLFYRIEKVPTKADEGSPILWIRDPIALQMLNDLKKDYCIVFTGAHSYVKQLYQSSDARLLEDEFCKNRVGISLGGTDFTNILLVSANTNRYVLVQLKGLLSDQQNPKFQNLKVELFNFVENAERDFKQKNTQAIFDTLAKRKLLEFVLIARSIAYLQASLKNPQHLTLPQNLHSAYLRGVHGPLTERTVDQSLLFQLPEVVVDAYSLGTTQSRLKLLFESLNIVDRDYFDFFYERFFDRLLNPEL